MFRKNLVRLAAISMAALMTFAPATTYAASILKRGSKGSEVKMVQSTLMQLGYFSYPKATGYYGTITERAVKKFQRDNGLIADGIVGKKTKGALFEESTENAKISLMSIEDKTDKAVKIDADKMGALDWFSDVQYIFDRGDNARITDVDTGRSFWVKRTFGTNHADIEPLTREDSKIIKDIWGGWSWERRAVVVEVDGYVLAGGMSAMPHAGLDSARAAANVSGRSGGYGYGANLDAVKNNGANGVVDLHFKNSRTHGTNKKQDSMQNAVKKADRFIKENYNK